MTIDLDGPAFASALRQAGTELDLPDYYQPCVRPLFRMPMTQWPLCCAGSCDPCAQKLVAVADRICQLLSIDPRELP